MKHCGTARPLHHTHPLLLEDPAARILSECVAAGKLYLSFSDKKKLIGIFHTQIKPALGLIRISGQ
jgi:hypothetical protein